MNTAKPQLTAAELRKMFSDPPESAGEMRVVISKPDPLVFVDTEGNEIERFEPRYPTRDEEVQVLETIDRIGKVREPEEVDEVLRTALSVFLGEEVTARLFREHNSRTIVAAIAQLLERWEQQRNMHSSG